MGEALYNNGESGEKAAAKKKQGGGPGIPEWIEEGVIGSFAGRCSDGALRGRKSGGKTSKLGQESMKKAYEKGRQII